MSRLAGSGGFPWVTPGRFVPPEIFTCRRPCSDHARGRAQPAEREEASSSVQHHQIPLFGGPDRGGRARRAVSVTPAPPLCRGKAAEIKRALIGEGTTYTVHLHGFAPAIAASGPPDRGRRTPRAGFLAGQPPGG